MHRNPGQLAEAIRGDSMSRRLICGKSSLGWLLFNEPLTLRMILATMTIVGGVCLIVSAKSDAPPKTPHPFTSGHGVKRIRVAIPRSN
jgi:hypothetical protein